MLAKTRAKKPRSTMQLRSTSVKSDIFGTSADENLTTLSNCSDVLIERNCFAERVTCMSFQSSKKPTSLHRYDEQSLLSPRA